MMDKEKQIFNDIKDLVIANINLEDIRLSSVERYPTKAIHQYAKNLFEILLADMQRIERKYTNEN